MATELASIVQSAHIKDEPSIEHDIAPPTAADDKYPAEILSPQQSRDADLSDTASETSATSTIPSDIIRPLPRRRPGPQHMPLPDLRFEQTYLASIKSAETTAQVVYITVRDQVLLPLIQGIGYHMLISGWRYMNRGTQFTGQSMGARLRKWWWEVNNWKIPATKSEAKAADVKDFYVGRFGSSMGD